MDSGGCETDPIASPLGCRVREGLYRFETSFVFHFPVAECAQRGLSETYDQLGGRVVFSEARDRIWPIGIYWCRLTSDDIIVVPIEMSV